MFRGRAGTLNAIAIQEVEMRKKEKKLALNKETLRQLVDSDLLTAQGAYPYSTATTAISARGGSHFFPPAQRAGRPQPRASMWATGVKRLGVFVVFFSPSLQSPKFPHRLSVCLALADVPGPCGPLPASIRADLLGQVTKCSIRCERLRQARSGPI